MQFITDVTVTVDQALYKDTSQLKGILQDYNVMKKGSCYQVKGSYKEMEDMYMKLSTLQQHTPSTKYENPAPKQGTTSGKYEDSALMQASNANYESSNHQGKHVSTPALQLEVDGIVMDYIKQKRSEEMDKIQGSDFWIVTHSSPSTARNNNAGKTAVIFKPRHRDISQARVHFIRERFITFYQRIATDLQVRTLDVHSHDYKVLQITFSKLVIEPERSKGKVKVIGSFVQILKLEDFVRGGSSTSRGGQSPRHTSPLHIASGGATGISPTHSKQPEEDELCAICMDTIKMKETLRCKHSFCKSCLKQAFEYKPVCPTCGLLYGALKGTQPEGGTMTVTKASSSLPGYEKCKTIVINYYIPNGIQKVRTQMYYV